MVEPLNPEDESFAKFHYMTYGRVERWCEGMNLDYEIDYASIFDWEQPDIDLIIKRDPENLEYPHVVGGRPDDSALRDFVVDVIRTDSKIKFKVAIFPAKFDLEKVNEANEDGERIEKAVEYTEEFYWKNDLEGGTVDDTGNDYDFCLFSIPVIVTPHGRDNNFDHAKQGDVHIICFDHIEEFLNSVFRSTNFYDSKEFLPKIFKSKYENCPDCRSNLSFKPVYTCTLGYADIYSRTFTGETLDNFTRLFKPEAGAPFVEEQLICDRCSEYLSCDKFHRTYDVVCMTCGWTESSHKIHPCSLAISERWREDCEDCYRPHDCENYEDLVSEGRLLDISNIE